MSVTFSVTYKVTPDELRGLGYNYLLVRGSATGDGSGGQVNSTWDFMNAVSGSDHVWFDNFGFWTDDSATQNPSIYIMCDDWTAFQIIAGTTQSQPLAMGTTKITQLGGYQSACEQRLNPSPLIYLGRPTLASANAYLYGGTTTNTNGKYYKYLARFLIKRPR